MKNRLVQFLVFLSALNGRAAPGWLQRLVPRDDLDALQSAERRLTDALRQRHPQQTHLPPALPNRIRGALHAESRPARASDPALAWLLPGGAVAVAAVFGAFLLFQGEPTSIHKAVESSEPVAQTASSATSGSSSSAQAAALPQALRVPDLPAELPDTVIVKPLEKEQQRLASDMSNALRFVAKGVLPDPYLERINLGVSNRVQQGTTY